MRQTSVKTVDNGTRGKASRMLADTGAASIMVGTTSRTRGVDVLINNLKRYRKNYKLSQEELAARSDLTTRCYGQIERGEVQPRLETLDKLSYGTGLSVAVLLTENFEFPLQLEVVQLELDLKM